MHCRLTSSVLSILSVLCLTQLAHPSPATRPATQPSNVPAAVAGNWVEGTVSPTTFWDIKTGVFQGNARGIGQYLTISRDGTYRQYIYMETRMYNLTTQIWTQHEGSISFKGDSFTLRPSKGHYRAAGTHKINRAMTEKELADKATTYKWKLEKDAKGNEFLILPFADGSSFRLRRTE